LNIKAEGGFRAYRAQIVRTRTRLQLDAVASGRVEVRGLPLDASEVIGFDLP
jgi:hypothetical protein